MLKLWAAALLGLALTVGPVTAGEKSQSHILTVVGELDNPNRSAFDTFQDAFFNVRGLTFEAAHAFDRRALASLRQVTVRAQIAGWPDAVTARGPRLADVIAEAGVAPEASLRLVALDGYEATLSADDRRAEDWVLALEANGAPLGIGGRGPAWVLHDTGGEILPDEAETNWVWSVYLIIVESAD